MLPQLANMPRAPAQKLAQGVRVYERFPGAQRVAQMGCVAIGVKPLPSPS